MPIIKLREVKDKTHKQVMTEGLRFYCNSCRLCKIGCEEFEQNGETLDPHVFSNMNYDSKYMVVGQNPGFNECKLGTPFIGAAGKNFDQELKNNGISRELLYITNIVKCRTPGNSKPDTTNKENCKLILEVEMVIIKPKLIITLGEFAFSYFCPELIYSENLGKISKCKYGKVFAIYHPSPLNINDPERRKVFNRQIELLCKLIKKIEETTQPICSTD